MSSDIPVQGFKVSLVEDSFRDNASFINIISVAVVKIIMECYMCVGIPRSVSFSDS